MNAKRALGVVGVLIAVMVALTGCVKLNMSVKVNNEKSVDYEVVYAIQKSVLGDKTFDEFMESNGSGGEMDIPEGSTVVDYEDEKYKGKRITAANLDPAKLAESSSSENPFQLKKEGDFYVLTMGGVTGAGNGDPSASSMAKSMFDEASVKFTFPGKVVEAQGATVEGNTATFDMLSVEESVVQAKAEANAGVPMWIIWILVAVLVIAAAVVLLFVLLRRKSAQQTPALAGAAPYGRPADAPNPGAYPQQPTQSPQADWAGQGYTPGAPPAQAAAPTQVPQPPAQQFPTQQTTQLPTQQPPGQRHDDGQPSPPPPAPPA
ncbi:LppM family (lipo)protein [Paenarthrobacter sp. NPDC091669]|uniref:LppM family (lipo)protein n=1 Tax=Paenarthrobacter sp. NPDC091669 TaxID=3364384 RepID=UPI0037F58059